MSASSILRPLAEVERDLILTTVSAVPDKLEAARLLGIGKTTLYRKLKEFADQPKISVQASALLTVGNTELRQAAVLRSIPIRVGEDPRRTPVRFLQIPSTPVERDQASLRCPRCRSLLVDVFGTTAQ